MINYNEALKILGNEFKQFHFIQEEIHILDSLDRILAEDIYTDVPFPSFDYSAMDGIGIMFNENIKQWNLKGEISAGNYAEIPIDKNSAVYITTGSKIPPDVDTVIPVEDLIITNEIAKLKVTVKYRKEQNVRKRGEDISAHERVIKRGAVIDIQHIPLAAACGKEKLKVFKKLKIGVLATGDELIPINEKPYDDKIRSSNLISIIAAIKRLNMTAIDLGIVKDNKLHVEKAIQTALSSDIDVLITTGGVSVGKFDYLNDVYKAEGVDMKISQVNIKPGKPFMFGIYGKDENKKFIFGLPGNPVSCLVNFILFFRYPLLNHFDPDNKQHIYARLTKDFRKKDTKRHFLRGYFYEENGENYVKTVGSQSSGDLYSIAQSNCLLEIEEVMKNLSAGESVKCIMI